MRRKTNLFYITGTDSNFLTFSNYTEAMTGNFLATNIKLFPSKFLCLDIPNLDNDNREAFIKYLAARYENKEAFLRDMCAYNDANGYEGYSVEEKTKPLGWLLDAIYEFDDSFEVTFVGQVTEQDYNGIYADTICIIDSTECTYATIERSEDYDKTSYEDYSYQSSKYLYGWYDTVESEERYTGPIEYSEVVPVVDGDNNYYYDARTKKLEIVHPDTPRDIKFNVIIPLFDITNINYNENTDVIKSMEEIDCMADEAGVINVPYGIWFAKEPVVLTRDNTSWSPAWSLAIGSQFKPFPYSKTPISEVDQAAAASSFMTFSQALIRQNKLLSKMSEANMQMSYLANRVTALEAAVRDLGTSYNIDSLNADIAKMRHDMSYMESYVGRGFSYIQYEIDTLAYNN